MSGAPPHDPALQVDTPAAPTEDRRMMYRIAAAVLAVAALLLPAACDTSISGSPRVSGDPMVQARYEAARRTLAEIKDLKKRGRIIYAECKTVELLFYKELKSHPSPGGRALAKEIKKTCKGIEVHGDPGS